MSNLYSPNRRLAQSLRNVIQNNRINDNQSLIKILEIVQRFLNNFEYDWSQREQQDYIDKCQQDIVVVIQQQQLSPIEIDKIQLEINESFGQIEKNLESTQSLDLKDFDALTTTLADMKQLIKKSFSCLIGELNAMKMNMNDLTIKVSKLEEESSSIKTMNFISDLFNPVIARLQHLLLNKNLLLTVLSKSRLEQVKRIIMHGKEENDQELISVTDIIKQVSNEFQLETIMTIDYLIKKKSRNEKMHFTRKIKDYAVLNNPNWKLADFLSTEEDIENYLFITEINALNGLFVCLCRDLITRDDN